MTRPYTEQSAGNRGDPRAAAAATNVSTRVILIRAINVGGAQLPMAELRAIASGLGATDVSTFIASGNLICTPPGAPEAFDRALESAIQERFGYFREAISRSPRELREALAAHPFDVAVPKYSYVTFLLEHPKPEAVAAARAHETGDDRWEVIGREMHIRYYGGAGRPQMKDAAIMRSIGVPGTARNLNTVRKLIELTELGDGDE